MPRPTRSRLTGSAKLRLTALLEGRVAGHVFQMGNGRLAFRYDDAWRSEPRAYPLSLSMPLSVAEHGNQATRAFLWGLLPDNPDVVAWWARRYGISKYGVVDLLSHIGEDCAGAVQFAKPERVDALIGSSNAADEANSIDWLSEDDVGGRLRDLRLNPAAARANDDVGQFSLAGAQPKTALYQDDEGRWGVPNGRVPTNRILKPPTLGLDDFAYNEHVCLRLAHELGFATAESRVLEFAGESAIVLERYDRTRIAGILTRIHQEDMCQALAVEPTRKYESDGGPGIQRIAALLDQHSSAAEHDVARFTDAIIFNWFIGGADAHGKNYSILHAVGPQLRLAPLYDLITVLPYPQLTKGSTMLAMAIDTERRVDAIGGSHWRALAKKVGLRPDAVVSRVVDLGEQIPQALDRLLADRGADERTLQVTARLHTYISDHVRRCLDRI